MSEKRRGLGRGLGALIPTGPSPYSERPSDVFFRDRQTDVSRETPVTGAAAWSQGPAWNSHRPADGQVPGPDQDSGSEPRQVVDGEAGRVGGPGAVDPLGAEDRASAEPAAPTSEEAYGGRGSAQETSEGTEPTQAGSPENSERERRPEDRLQPVPGARYVEVPLEAIRANPRQPRTVFDEDELHDLSESIRGVGLLQPVVVRPLGADELGRPDGGTSDSAEAMAEESLRHDTPTVSYELVMGERRWRAARLAGLVSVPAIVKDTPDDAMLRDALLENLHRSQLNPLDEAAAYQQLLEDFGCTQDELAGRIGRSRSQISNTVRLLRLPPGVARRVAAGVLSAGHARALLSLDEPEAMERLAQRIVAEGLSVRSVEEIVALGETGPVPPRRTREPAPANERLETIAARLSDRLDTRVVVAMGRRRGKLTVEFADPDDLERIVGLLEADKAAALAR